MQPGDFKVTREELRILIETTGFTGKSTNTDYR
jgi:hypothetical protein